MAKFTVITHVTFAYDVEADSIEEARDTALDLPYEEAKEAMCIEVDIYEEGTR